MIEGTKIEIFRYKKGLSKIRLHFGERIRYKRVKLSINPLKNYNHIKLQATNEPIIF